MVMFNAKSLLLATILAGAGAAQAQTAAVDCSDYSVADDQTVDQLMASFKHQSQLEAAFACAGVPDALPLGTGVGSGSFRAAPLGLNQAQAAVGSLIWGGKILTADDSGRVTLLNIMRDGGNLRYNAEVYKTVSMFDGQETIVLDYRIDTTAQESLPRSLTQPLVDAIVHGIRDEIREVRNADGTGTGVYIGRVYLYKNLLSLPFTTISDDTFGDASRFHFVANFFLDFRGNAAE